MTENTRTDLVLASRKDLSLTIADGVIQNLPQIMTALQDVYRIHKRTQTFSQIVQANISVLNVNKENFSLLIKALTELSKDPNGDPETKSLYREMIKALHSHFMNAANMATGMADFLDKI